VKKQIVLSITLLSGIGLYAESNKGSQEMFYSQDEMMNMAWHYKNVLENRVQQQGNSASKKSDSVNLCDDCGKQRELKNLKDKLVNAKGEGKNNCLHIILDRVNSTKTSFKEVIELAKLYRAIVETTCREKDGHSFKKENLLNGKTFANSKGKTPNDLHREKINLFCDEESKEFNPDRCARCLFFDANTYPNGFF